jgi:formylglycine-generating enzyme required for sulfatase activity
MHGNVWQWCDDSWGGDTVRVIRGSGWSNDGFSCLAAFRDGCLRWYRFANYGVRLARVIR